MEQKKAPAGYTFLKLISKGTYFETFENLAYAIVERKRGKYLSSNLFMTKNNDNNLHSIKDNFLSKIAHMKEPHGPSIPLYYENFDKVDFPPFMAGLTHKLMDFVRAFPCHAGEILEAWKKRKRNYSWPTQVIIDKVMSFPTQVVPVGKMGSIDGELQWRISFTLAEIHLIQSFNNTQTKVFVLMKLIAKHILQPMCHGISSYIMKTVMLWLAEEIDQTAFCEDNLMSRMMDALAFLKTGVENKNLPSYMIPKKNLLENKITREEQQLLLRKLTFLQVNAFKMVNKFFNGWCPFNCYRKIEKIRRTFYNANLMDIFVTMIVSCYTSEELAGWLIKIHTSKSLRNFCKCVANLILCSFYLQCSEKDIPLQKVTRKRKLQRKETNRKKLKLRHIKKQ
jgi:hypothetical protein